jgi:hypothetical protein
MDKGRLKKGCIHVAAVILAAGIIISMVAAFLAGWFFK